MKASSSYHPSWIKLKEEEISVIQNNRKYENEEMNGKIQENEVHKQSLL